MEEGVNNIAEHVHNSRQSSGWNPCKPHAEDAPRLSKYHAKVFGMTRYYAKPSKYHAKTKVLKITKCHAIRQGFRCATQLRGKVLL